MAAEGTAGSHLSLELLGSEVHDASDHLPSTQCTAPLLAQHFQDAPNAADHRRHRAMA